MEHRYRKVRYEPIRHRPLKRIAPGFSYEEIRDDALEEFECQEKHTNPSRFSVVNTVFYYEFEEALLENGIEKMMLMVAALLYQIDRGKVDSDIAYETVWDIDNFETGGYEDLVSEEDLALLKKDFDFIHEYLSKHTYLLAD
ncbi:MAG: hypothetical protein IJ955_10390 [Oscillospiraceae bacterium]|nr:hypothetical protein [Oscillospiraceae bacterium]